MHKKSKLGSNVDAYLEAMKNKESFDPRNKEEEEDPHSTKVLLVGTVSVQVTKPRDSFYILVDGALVGPLKKITVDSSTLKHEQGKAESFELPVQSFFPLAAFTRDASKTPASSEKMAL